MRHLIQKIILLRIQNHVPTFIGQTSQVLIKRSEWKVSHPFLGPHLTLRSPTEHWIPICPMLDLLGNILHLQLGHVMSTICDFCIIKC